MSHERRSVGEGHAILIFMTTQAALQAEDALLEEGLDIEVVPKPPGLQGLCGIALALWVSDLAVAEGVLARDGIPFSVYDEAMAEAYASRLSAAGAGDRESGEEAAAGATGPAASKAHGRAVAAGAKRVYTAESASSRGTASECEQADNRILTPAPAERPGPHESEGGEPN